MRPKVVILAVVLTAQALYVVVASYGIDVEPAYGIQHLILAIGVGILAGGVGLRRKPEVRP